VNCYEQETTGVAVIEVTFYDASYVFVAKSNDLTLVSEDEKLMREG